MSIFINDLEQLMYLADPTTSTLELTLLSSQVLELKERQNRTIELLNEVLDYMVQNEV